jgi:hypothetical protein
MEVMEVKVNRGTYVPKGVVELECAHLYVVRCFIESIFRKIISYSKVSRLYKKSTTDFFLRMGGLSLCKDRSFLILERPVEVERSWQKRCQIITKLLFLWISRHRSI